MRQPRAQRSTSTVYVLMKSTISEESKPVLKRVGKINSVWNNHQDALVEMEWNIDLEISQTGKQTNGYWIECRGVLEV